MHELTPDGYRKILREHVEQLHVLATLTSRDLATVLTDLLVTARNYEAEQAPPLPPLEAI